MNIAEYATSIVKLSPTLEQEIVSLLKKEELPKKRLLHDEGQICQRIYFVEKGLVRAFYYKDDGKDITDWFAPENSFITAVDSFFQQKPSRYFLEMLEDSVLYSLTYHIHRHPDFWVEPEAFDPDRWLPEHEKRGHQLSFMPFGAGQRLCIGNHMALMEGELLLAQLAQQYEPRLASPGLALPEVGVTMTPKNGLPMLICSRI